MIKQEWHDKLNDSKKLFYGLLFIGSLIVIAISLMISGAYILTYLEKNDTLQECLQYESNKDPPRNPYEPDCFDMFFSGSLSLTGLLIFTIIVALSAGSHSLNMLINYNLNLSNEPVYEKIKYAIGCILIIIIAIIIMNWLIFLFKIIKINLDSVILQRELYSLMNK